MSLIVRRVRVQDLPSLERLEVETVKRFPNRKGWLETYGKLIQRALDEEPEGLLVAEVDGHVVGSAIVRQRGPHPINGHAHGQLYSLTVSPPWRTHGVAQRLLKEAEAYLKSRGCTSLHVNVPTDAGEDTEIFKAAGYGVAGWELLRPL